MFANETFSLISFWCRVEGSFTLENPFHFQRIPFNLIFILLRNMDASHLWLLVRKIEKLRELSVSFDTWTFDFSLFAILQTIWRPSYFVYPRLLSLFCFPPRKHKICTASFTVCDECQMTEIVSVTSDMNIQCSREKGIVIYYITI